LLLALHGPVVVCGAAQAHAGGGLMKLLLILAGLGQLALALGSLALPRMLGWKEQTAKLRPLTRQMFWTYASYIWVTNICFGVISTLTPGLLLDGAVITRLVCGYITCYWGARLGIQFFYFDRTDAPNGWFYTLSEVGLVILFAYLTGLYGWIALGLG